MPNFIDITGQRFGRLLVLERAPNRGKATSWLCRCDCGAEKQIVGGPMKMGVVVSCGCFQKENVRLQGIENRTHGHSLNYRQSRSYCSWQSMKVRCYKKNDPAYERYGGRGITVCERWLTFENFLVDMGERPEGCTLDRIDNNGNYEPGNCRWATATEQANNKRNTVFIEISGVIRTVAEWREIYDISRSCYQRRIKRGLNIVSAITFKKKRNLQNKPLNS